MGVYEGYKKIVTEQEKESIRRYLGFQHEKINILADLTPKRYWQLERRGWALPKSGEKVKQLIEDFVNVYSAMYKNGENYHGGGLVRGTSTTEVAELGSEFNQLVSTSTDEEIAKRFTEYQDGALIQFYLRKGVPSLNAEEYRRQNSESEKEIILAPFCTINRIEKGYKIDGFQYYSIVVEPPILQSKSPEELDKLMEEVVQGFSQNIDNIKEEQHFNEVEEFREKLQTLLKGLCKQREQEIDKAEQVIEQDKIRQAEETKISAKEMKKREEEWRKETAEIREREEKKWREEEAKIRARREAQRREEERIKAEQDKKDKVQEIIFKAERNPENAKNLNSLITRAYQQLLNNERIYKQKAEILGIDYTKISSNTKIAERVKAIQDRIVQVQEVVDNLSITENDSQETVAENSKRVIPLMDGIQFGAIQAESLSKIVNLHMTQSETEIKRNLYNKVQETIQNARIQKYMAEKEEISNKKIGFLGRLTGKQKLQDEKINQLNLKIQLAKTTQPQEKGKYSVKDILADIKVCAKTDFDGNLTPEMLNLYTTIKQNFVTKEKQTFSEEKIEVLANKKIRQQQNKFLVPFQNPPSFFGRTKFQLDSLKQENMALKSQIMEEIQKGNMSYVKLSTPVDAIAAFDSKLDKIQRTTTEQKLIDKDGPTAELW